ncbi:hypothetical protein VKT23_015896 [Stygiomarasmius scandens]|uniref:WD40 repeat-like protein n=1 Tax=Marasmiellus scandens TaxID=2682957 RepID=A0ABR1IYJ5_9AGAR
MSPALVWKPSATIVTDGDPGSDGVTAMQFSADGRFLAVGSGCSVEIWDVREDIITNSFHVGGATTSVRCLQWFRHCYALVTGHDDGGMYSTTLLATGPSLSGFRADGHHSTIKAISLWEDVVLAAATSRSVQIWELINNQTWTMRGTLPASPAIGPSTPTPEQVSQSIHWLSGQEVLVSYEGLSVARFGIRCYGPLEAELLGVHRMAGLVNDICLPTKNILVCDSVLNQYQLYSWADLRTTQLSPLPASFVPRSRQFNRALPVSKAVFCTEDTVVGGSGGKCLLWDLSGRRLADLTCPEYGDRTISSVSCAYDYSLDKPRLATAIDGGRNNTIILWETVEDKEDIVHEDAIGPAADHTTPSPVDIRQNWRHLNREQFSLVILVVSIIFYVLMSM